MRKLCVYDWLPSDFCLHKLFHAFYRNDTQNFTEMTLEALHEWSGYMRLDAAVVQLKN